MKMFKVRLKLFEDITLKDILGLFIFLQIPLSFFLSNFIQNFRVFYYAILALFIISYTLIGQFFFEQEKLSSLGKKLIALTVINTVILSFINFSGNLVSPYFFILYILIFTISIYLPPEVLVLECLIIFFSIFTAEVYYFQSVGKMFESISPQELSNLFSILIIMPLTMVIASFVRNLQKKQGLLSLSKDLLAVRDIEDEALLEEINQGIIVLDSDQRIIKISRWVEKEFNLVAPLLLGKRIRELVLYDAVSNKKLLSSDYFYKNLNADEPQQLSWRILYKNQYGKFKKFVIKQTPLIVEKNVIGFLFIIKYPPKKVSELVSSFNQILGFRLSSNIAVIKNLLAMSKDFQKDPVYPNIKNNLDVLIKTLNDTAIRNDITDGNREITLTDFDLNTLTNNVIKKIDPIRNIAVWNISPIYKTQSVSISSDKELCKKLIEYAIRSALYLSKDSSLNISFDEDENIKRPRIIISVNIDKKFPEGIDVLEPFFAGKLSVLTNYPCSCLELYNENIIAKFLSFDFYAGISNNKLIIKIIF